LQGDFTISSKVGKFRREQEQSVSTVYCRSNNDRQLPTMRIFSHCSPVTQKPKMQDQRGAG